MTGRYFRARNHMQKRLREWGAAAFGEAHVSSPPQRAVRFLEEAIELYQSCGADPEMAHKLIDYVFSRPVGELRSEFGGVGVTVLMLAEACDLSAAECEAAEMERVLSKGAAHFTERNREKNAAGFDVTGAYPCQPDSH